MCVRESLSTILFCLTNIIIDKKKKKKEPHSHGSCVFNTGMIVFNPVSGLVLGGSMCVKEGPLHLSTSSSPVF